MTRGKGSGAADETVSIGVRRAIELVEQAPAEALYVKLMNVLAEAGTEASMRGDEPVSKRLAFAYKLTVELGAKLALLEEDDLAERRGLAAAILGDGEQPSWEEALGEVPDPTPRRIWTPRGWS
jgi:hypothetical protein